MFHTSIPSARDKSREKGFTLIELLVVIAIIGLLSSIVLVSLNAAREKARDGKRVMELKQLQNALELYYAKYGCYPIGTSNPASRSTVLSPCPAGNSVIVGGCAATNTHWNISLQVLVDDGLVPSLPVDPINQTKGGKDYCYNYSRVKPNVSSWSCGGVIRTNYAYTFSFSTESSQLSLPLSDRSHYDYCIVGEELF